MAARDLDQGGDLMHKRQKPWMLIVLGIFACVLTTALPNLGVAQEESSSQAAADEASDSSAQAEGESETTPAAEGGTEGESGAAEAVEDDSVVKKIQKSFEPLDSFFGEWVVGPMASVLFFDVVFFDNQDPTVAAIVAQLKGGDEFTLAELAKELDVDAKLIAVAAQKLRDQQLIERVADNAGNEMYLVSTPGRILNAIAENKIQNEAQLIEALDLEQATVAAAISELGKLELINITREKNDEGTVVDTYSAAGDIQIPIIVAWLVLGAIFFTLRMGFINLRGVMHAVHVTMGKYDNPKDTGEISHFQALSSALSATVGLGNIAGVAIAVSVGGPGAIFWMIVAGFLGMSSKFVECSLGQMYRTVEADGHVLGGPMRYLSAGLQEMRLGVLGKVLAFLFALLCIGGSFGGGNMFQANQSFAAIVDVTSNIEGMENIGDFGWLYGLILAFLVGIVIIGGVKSIGRAASVIVPFMCLLYMLAGFTVLFLNVQSIPTAIGVIISGAFNPSAAYGGALGVLIQGFRRAAFSNEAGTGSASIAHSAAATEEPIREGIVALLEPFIDTIVVCTMTGLVVVITGEYLNNSAKGIEMTSAAFGSAISWFPWVLTTAVVLFAFSTMISWSYYGERCVIWLFGPGASLPYKIIFLMFIVFGAVFKLGNVLDFSDLMILGMAFPNVLGLVLLSGKVRSALNSYWERYQAGKFDVKK